MGPPRCRLGGMVTARLTTAQGFPEPWMFMPEPGVAEVTVTYSDKKTQFCGNLREERGNEGREVTHATDVGWAM